MFCLFILSLSNYYTYGLRYLSRMINVIIIDDHELFRLGVRNALIYEHDDMNVVGEAGTGKELFGLLKTCSPDIILLDIVLPDMSGIEIARQVKNEHPEIKILALSAESTQDTIQQMLNAGAEGFISKRLGSMEVLGNAIRAIMDGESYYGRDICEIIYAIYSQENGNSQTEETFTPHEKNIIDLCRMGLTSRQIGEKLNISSRTVDNHKYKIFKKLGINSTMEMVQYALEKGIIS